MGWTAAFAFDHRDQTRFGGLRATGPVEMLSDNGSVYTARETRIFARQLGLTPCLTPVRTPQSNGTAEAFDRLWPGDPEGGGRLTSSGMTSS